MLKRLTRRGTFLGVWLTLTAAVWARPTTAPKIEFLETEAGRKAIVNDAQEPYFSRLRPMEMSAKTGAAITGESLEQQQEQCRRRYWSAVSGFTPEEKEGLRLLVKKLHPVLFQEYPLFAEMAWSFLRVADRIEGGLPHTRGAHIVLPERKAREIALLRRAPKSEALLAPLLQMLVHEQMHVFQRQHAGYLDPLYEKVWGFEKAAAIRGCPWLAKHQALNPDAVDCPWILPIRGEQGPRYVWPMVVFADSAREGEAEAVRRMPDDFQMLGIDLEKTTEGYAVKTAVGKPVSRELASISEITRLFPLTHHRYHPHEAAADTFAFIVVTDHFLTAGRLPEGHRESFEGAMAPVRQWFKEHLRKG